MASQMAIWQGPLYYSLEQGWISQTSPISNYGEDRQQYRGTSTPVEASLREGLIKKTKKMFKQNCFET